MVKKLLIIFMISYISIVNTGCNTKKGFIYEMSIGAAIGKAVKVDIVGLGTELGNDGKEITGAILNLQITNIGTENVNPGEDITITAVQGNNKVLMTTNTMIEAGSLAPHDTGTYETGFNFVSRGDVKVNIELSGQVGEFIITTSYPAKITGL